MHCRTIPPFRSPAAAHLKRTKYLKISVILFTLALSICFIALMVTGSCTRRETSFAAITPRCNSLRSAAAVCEWVASLFFDFYLMTVCTFFIPLFTYSKRKTDTVRFQFIVDYYPVTRSSRKRQLGQHDSSGSERFTHNSELGQIQQQEEDRPMSEAHTLDRAFSTTPGPVPTNSGGRISGSTDFGRASPLPPSHDWL